MGMDGAGGWIGPLQSYSQLVETLSNEMPTPPQTLVAPQLVSPSLRVQDGDGLLH